MSTTTAYTTMPRHVTYEKDLQRPLVVFDANICAMTMTEPTDVAIPPAALIAFTHAPRRSARNVTRSIAMRTAKI